MTEGVTGGGTAAARCADTARVRQDPPLGTAPPTLRWLLVEHPGPWGPDALPGAGFPTAVQGALGRAASAARARILLMRRPGRTPRSQDSRAWAVSVGGNATVWGRWRDAEDLLEAGEVLAAPRLPAGAEPDPLLLVCAHGVHDVCCALRGRALAAALAERWPARTWECSHVGGCRFAANLLVLPDGAYYGNLDPVHAREVVDDHLAGRMTVEFLRGLARHPPVAQTAVGVALQRWGPFAAEDVQVRRVAQQAPDAWEVDLLLAGRPAVRMTVQSSARPAARLTCRAPRETSAATYAVRSVRQLPDGENSELRGQPFT